MNNWEDKWMNKQPNEQRCILCSKVFSVEWYFSSVIIRDGRLGQNQSCVFVCINVIRVCVLLVCVPMRYSCMCVLIWWFSICACMSLQWRHNGHDNVSNHQPHDCLLIRLFRRRSKKISKLRVTGLCAGNSPGPVPEFPTQMASNAANVSIWWRHHVHDADGP